MATAPATVLAVLDGSRINGGPVHGGHRFRPRRSLAGPAGGVVDQLRGGAVLFIALPAAAWWRARSRDERATAGATAGSAAAAAAHPAGSGVKDCFKEPRPCRMPPHGSLLEACPAPGDHAFPGNHTAVAFAAAAALPGRRPPSRGRRGRGRRADGASRVYAGAHYPHDVPAATLAGTPAALAGTSVALPAAPAGRDPAAPAVARPHRRLPAHRPAAAGARGCGGAVPHPVADGPTSG
ncbi:phosphatase PAP2 family protein [Streptomyces sp. NPDC052095]|uniref:phosphatase PAP2 family protein n=1 Tax=Streptomyces sp. NPDC052095 TaxID=3155678 RepID=UPI00344E0E6D